MTAKRARMDGLIAIASRIPWRVGMGLAVASAMILHLLADTLSEPIHASKLEDLKYSALRSLVWTFASIGQLIVPLLFGIGAFASYLTQGRGKTRRDGGPPRGKTS
jgi:TctA family transporter